MKYCPKCKTEYEDRVKICAECSAVLVNHLPEVSINRKYKKRGIFEIVYDYHLNGIIKWREKLDYNRRPGSSGIFNRGLGFYPPKIQALWATIITFMIPIVAFVIILMFVMK